MELREIFLKAYYNLPLKLRTELIVVIDLLTSEFPDTDLTPGPLSEMLTQRLRKTVTPEDIHRYHAYVAALESEDIKLWYNLNLTS